MSDVSPPPAPRRRRRWLRWLAWSAAVLGALLLGASLYVRRPSFRARVVRAVNRALEGSMRGRVTLSELSELGLSSARLERLEVTDEHGATVLTLDGIRAHYSLLGLLGPWLPGSSATLGLGALRVEHAWARVALDPATGQPTLLRALGKERTGAPGAGRRGLSVSLPAVELGEAEIELDVPALGQGELRLDHVQGGAWIAGDDTRVSVERFGVQLLEQGQRALMATGSLELEGGGVARGGLHGFVQGTEVDAAFRLERGGVLTAQLDVPQALPERVRALVPGWPLRSPVAARLNAHGPLAALALQGYVTLERGRLELTGNADLTHAPRVQLELSAHAIDLGMLLDGAPETALEARARLSVSRPEAGWIAEGTGTLEPASIGTWSVPEVALDARTERGQTTLHVQLADARGALAADAVLAPDGSTSVTARLSRVSLASWPQLGGEVHGTLELTAHARLAAGRVEGALDGRLGGLGAGAASIGSGRLRGSFAGALDALDDTALELTLTGDDVQLGPARLERVRVTGRGTWDSSRLDAELQARDGARGTARARLDVGEQIRIRDLDARFGDRELELAARVSDWRPAPGILVVDRLALSGAAGSLEGSARLAPGRSEATLKLERLDTDRLARRLGVSSRVRGTLSGEAQLRTRTGDTHGALTLHADALRIDNLSWRSFDTQLTLDDQRVDLRLEARDAALGHLLASAALELDGGPLEPRAWLGATGSASLALGELPLWPIGLVLPPASRVQELGGQLDISLKLERPERAFFPDVLLEAKTRELAFELAPGGAEAARRFEQYALAASASIDGRSGRGAATLRVLDQHGALVTSSGAVELDARALLRDPAAVLERLFDTPIDALIRLHPRPVSLLPPPLGARDLAGNVEATLQLRGSLAEPTLSLAAHAHQLQGGLAGVERAVDVTSIVEYVPKTGRLQAIADVVEGGQSVVVARAEGRVPNPLGPSPPSFEQVELHAAAMLNGVPLELLPVAARERVEARLYGSVDLDKQRGGGLRQRAHLEIGELSAQGQPLGNGRLTFESSDAGLRAELRLGTRDHYLRASVRDAAAAGSPAPGAASTRDAGLGGSLTAHDFHAASLSPLTSGLLTRLSGSMNAELRFHLKREGADHYLGIDGKANVTGGSAHIDELGLEVRDIAAEVTARSTPEYTVLQIDPLRAKARSRGVNLRGDAELWLRGFRVTNGEANLALDDVPLSLKGVSRGIARGHVRARLTRMPDHLQLEVKIPDLRVRLPASSTRTLIALDENPDFYVAQLTEPAEEQAADALLWKIQFDLGDRVRIQRGDLDVPITGRPTLEYQHEVRPSGSIRALPGGRIMLFNQNFNVDRALLQLVPDEPDNPRIDLTASWRAPDGTTVYVDVTGTAEDATILTRDDRGLQEVERFYLITGGQSAGRELADAPASRTGALGQTFSLGINELLRDSLGNVAVSVGTTADDRASYSASVRLTDKLTFQGSFQPAAENNLEEATNDLTGTLDYRFTRSWSLRTELGTSGGAFDLLWSHRY